MIEICKYTKITLTGILNKKYSGQQNSLNLSKCRLNAEKLYYVIQDGRMDNLKTLHLSHNNLGERGVKVLASRDWPKLEILSLDYNQLGGNGVEYLCQNSWQSLQQLNLNENILFIQGPYLLLKRTYASLTVIMLDGNKLNYQSFALLLQIKQTNFKNLVSISLSNNPIHCKGMKYLPKLPLPSLQYLYLGCCNLGNQGVKLLTKGHWPAIKLISLHENGISLAGFQTMLQGLWKTFQQANLSNNIMDIISIMHLVACPWQTSRVHMFGIYNWHFHHIMTLVWKKKQGQQPQEEYLQEFQHID